MRIDMHSHLGWKIWAHLSAGGRFVNIKTWTAKKEGETVTLEASELPELIKLIEMREAHHG